MTKARTGSCFLSVCLAMEYHLFLKLVFFLNLFFKFIWVWCKNLYLRQESCHPLRHRHVECAQCRKILVAYCKMLVTLMGLLVFWAVISSWFFSVIFWQWQCLQFDRRVPRLRNYCLNLLLRKWSQFWSILLVLLESFLFNAITNLQDISADHSRHEMEK